VSAAAEACTGDRIVLAWRAGRESPEWDALRAHVQVCDECRATWQTMQWFDGAGRARPGDERLVGRAVEAALAKRVTRARAPRRRAIKPALAVAASMILAGAMASAGIALHRSWPLRTQEESDGAAGVERRSARHRRARIVPAHSTAPEIPADPDLPGATPAPPMAPEALAPESAPPVAAPAEAARDVAVPSAEELPEPAGRARSRRTDRADLFARATAAQRAGRAVEAIMLFRRLEREMPRSSEAVVALVSLGRLLAEAGEQEAALNSFDTYLRRSPSGALVPEALAARAGLLARLGRAAEARASREELERRFPGSPYGTRPARAGGDVLP
jgi:TolA-binding protein